MAKRIRFVIGMTIVMALVPLHCLLGWCLFLVKGHFINPLEYVREYIRGFIWGFNITRRALW